MATVDELCRHPGGTECTNVFLRHFLGNNRRHQQCCHPKSHGQADTFVQHESMARGLHDLATGLEIQRIGKSICSCQTTKRPIVSARHHFVYRAIRGKLNSELASKGAFGFPQHLEASLPISRCIGSIHALHVLLFRGHTPFANGRSIGAIQIARRSWNYSFGHAYREHPIHAQAISTSLLA